MVSGVKAGDLVVERGQLMIAQGAIAYAATPQGLPLDENLKPINPAETKNFIARATQIKAELMAKAALQAGGASQPAAKPGAPAESKKNTESQK